MYHTVKFNYVTRFPIVIIWVLKKATTTQSWCIATMLSRIFLIFAVLFIGTRLRKCSNMSKFWNTQRINIPSLAIPVKLLLSSKIDKYCKLFIC